MAEIWKKYSYDHVHDATSMAYILKELAGADKLRAMKLAPAPNSNKANAVNKYRSILQGANNHLGQRVKLRRLDKLQRVGQLTGEKSECQTPS